MNRDDIPSVLLSNAVGEFNKLPGIGSKTALRLVLHLLNQNETEVKKFTSSLTLLKENVKFCSVCQNISDTPICTICSNSSRLQYQICVVESIRDVMAIEKTMQYKGLYHVLGGIISPMDGIGPSDIAIDSLIHRVNEWPEGELIFALPATMEGDTTCFYIHKKLDSPRIKFSTLSRGIAIGNDIEYADEVTLGRSIVNRTPFNVYSHK
jgi:recombination protein RecR